MKLSNVASLGLSGLSFDIRNFAVSCIHKIIATVIVLNMLMYKPFLGLYFFNNSEYVLSTCAVISAEK